MGSGRVSIAASALKDIILTRTTTIVQQWITLPVLLLYEECSSVLPLHTAKQPTNPHTHFHTHVHPHKSYTIHIHSCSTHTSDNGQREEVQGLFLSNFHWFYTSSVQELVDKQKIKLCRGWHIETSITKWLKIYRRLYLGYFYQFTLTFIGFTTFRYLKNLSFLYRKMK